MGVNPQIVVITVGGGDFDKSLAAIGAHADLLLFDPATVGVTAASRVADLPGGGLRTIRGSTGVHGVFVNGVEVYGGDGYAALDRGPGQVLDSFNRSSGAAAA